MAAANVELVRSIVAAWERGDYSSAEWADDEIEFVEADGPAPGRWSGLAGVTEATHSLIGAWQNFRVAAEVYRELDDERVLVLTRLGGRGKASGIELGRVNSAGATVFRIQGGKVKRIEVHWDRGRALADLGLAPEVD